MRTFYKSSSHKESGNGYYRSSQEHTSSLEDDMDSNTNENNELQNEPEDVMNRYQNYASPQTPFMVKTLGDYNSGQMRIPFTPPTKEKTSHYINTVSNSKQGQSHSS